MYVSINCSFVLEPVVSMETRIMCMYIYYTAILVPGDPLCGYRGYVKRVCILYFHSGACSQCTNLSNVYVYYTVVLVPINP